MLSFCTSGYQELARDGETPTVGSDYLLEALDDFQYDMSFTVHMSQGITPFLHASLYRVLQYFEMSEIFFVLYGQSYFSHFLHFLTMITLPY